LLFFRLFLSLLEAPLCKCWLGQRNWHPSSCFPNMEIPSMALLHGRNGTSPIALSCQCTAPLSHYQVLTIVHHPGRRQPLYCLWDLSPSSEKPFQLYHTCKIPSVGYCLSGRRARWIHTPCSCLEPSSRCFFRWSGWEAVRTPASPYPTQAGGRASASWLWHWDDGSSRASSCCPRAGACPRPLPRPCLRPPGDRSLILL
jgi:hypothetical protein